MSLENIQLSPNIVSMDSLGRTEDPNELSPRERHYVSILAATSLDPARVLHIANRTVGGYRMSIYRKLGIPPSLPTMVFTAHQRGLIDPALVPAQSPGEFFMKPTPPSPRESEWLELMARGATKKEGGRIIGVSEDTVKKYNSSLFDRFGVDTATDLVRAAIITGVLEVKKESVPEAASEKTAPEISISDKSPEAPLVVDLNSKQMECLRLCVQGHRERSVAKLMNISERTVGSHVNAIMRALEVNSRGELIRESFKKGIVRLVSPDGTVEQPLLFNIEAAVVEDSTIDNEPRNIIELNTRQLKLLKLLAQGLRRNEIARSLKISDPTLGSDISSTCAAFGVSSKEDLYGISLQGTAIRIVSDEKEDRLSTRENECLRLTVQGLKNGEIAKLMNISIRTVGIYVASIYKFFGVNSRGQLIHKAEVTVVEDAAGDEEPGSVIALTERELEVLRFAAQGLKQNEIAQHMKKSHRTIGHHLANARNKNGLKSTPALIARARAEKLI